MPDSVVRVVLADDHPVFRHGVADLLRSSGMVNVLATVDTGTAALRAIAELAPDIAVLDIAMPEMNGVAVVRSLSTRGSNTRGIILSVYDSRVYIDQAFEAGAWGYVCKRSAFQNISQAVRAVFSGGTYVDPMLPTRTVPHQRYRSGPAHDECNVQLGQIEKDILRHVAFGFTSKEIAGRLCSTAKTVESQKSRACVRLGITSRAQIVQFAILQGWLSAEIPLS